MEFLGIKWASLNIPLHRRVETLAIAAAFTTIVFGGIIGTLVLTYLIFYTRYWPAGLLYLIWIYIDADTSEIGGRRSEWIRNWTWWKYVRNYFPIRLECVPGIELNPKRNYLFCFYPHGVLPYGFFTVFVSNYGGFQERFPRHTTYPVTLKQNFYMPILRELLLGLGGCSSSKKSLNWILGSPEGGKVAVLAVGGAAEALNCNHGQYRIILKRRKGFIKLALTNGTPLVPVFSFGETDLYNQLEYPKGSLIRNLQEWIKDKTGFTPVIPVGRGFFQYSFGLLPHRKPIFTIIGKPIEVERVEHPSQNQIDTLHEKFTQKLVELFEEQKYNYVRNPRAAKLVIV